MIYKLIQCVKYLIFLKKIKKKVRLKSTQVLLKYKMLVNVLE